MIEMILKPYGADNRIERMEVRIEFAYLNRRAKEELCNIQTSTVTIPGCEPENFTAEDELGTIPLQTKRTSPYPYELMHWMTERDTRGAVVISYTVRPRVLKDSDICGPYFDFRNEDGGASSAGLSFLPHVEGAEDHIHLHWDFSHMPDKTRGVCSLGSGDFTTELGLETLSSSYFMVGAIHSIEDGEFGFYWLSETPFPMEEMAVYTRDLFGKMQKFFRDTNPLYRIFIRKDPFKTSGGTALHRSYMLGWNETQPFSIEEKQFILSHEMVHNWPHLNDNPYGITTWYAEGTAEFYSLMLPLRNGLTTKEKAAEELQKRTDAYYSNPTRSLENQEAAAICWKDRRAQRLAYGRGLFFFANVDCMIKRATNHEKSLDDVVLSLLEMGNNGTVLGNEVFLEEVRRITGLDVSKEWEIMRTGTAFAPDPDSFDALFTTEEKQIKEADTDNIVISYQWRVR